ncbi:MAG: NUDIX hydrolase, partial [Candidatus Competibacter sp.]
LIFQGRLKDGYACPGEESLEVRLYAEAEIPWDQIAFTVVHEALRQYFSERRTGQFHHHLGDIIREADQRFRLHRYY